MAMGPVLGLGDLVALEFPVVPCISLPLRDSPVAVPPLGVGAEFHTMDWSRSP